MVAVVESYEELEGYNKVATLDMGGTLVADEEAIPTHAKINMAFGLSEEEEKDLYDEFVGDNGDLEDHAEHARKQTEVLRGRPDANIDVYAETVQDIIDQREVLDGAEYFVEKLDSIGYETIVVSSAPLAVTIPFSEQIGVDKLYNWKNVKFTDDGYFDRVRVNPEAENGKQEIISGLQEIGVDVAHFGNGDNDKQAREAADAGKMQFWKANPERAFEYAFLEARKL